MKSTSKGQRRRGRPPKGERDNTRQDLLDAALQLFADQGYAATTVRQIADVVGIRDSAIYAHFSAKQELLDNLIAESGPHLLDRLDITGDGLTDAPPAEVLPELAKQLVKAWGRRRSRMLISVVTREGLVGTREATEDLQERLRPAFVEWAEEGELRDDLSVDHLLWEFTAPLVAIRLLYLHSQAGTAERREGRELAGRHVSYFITTATVG